MNTIIRYDNENDFKKLERSLKKYCGKSWKYYCFQILPKLRKEHKLNGEYEINLLADDLFCKVYGDIKLLFRVENDVAILEKFIPEDILLDGYMLDLPTIKGIPFRDDKDLFKIKLMG